MEQIFITKTQLKDRIGWSEACIKLFDLNHDKEAINPIYRKASPVKLFLLDKIEQIESSEQFKEFEKKNFIRRKSMLKVSENKRNELLEYINNLEIIVPNFDKNYLIKVSCDHYNSYNFDKVWNRTPATKDSDEVFLSRICTNYLRHNMTNYESELEKLFGKVGKYEAYNLLKTKINSAIFEKYAWIQYDT